MCKITSLYSCSIFTMCCRLVNTGCGTADGVASHPAADTRSPQPGDTRVWTSGQWTGHYLLIRAISHRIFIRLNNMSSPLMIVVLQLPSLMKWYNITTS